jgi:hypothetical protein
MPSCYLFCERSYVIDLLPRNDDCRHFGGILTTTVTKEL